MCGKAVVARHDASSDVEEWEYRGYGPAAKRGKGRAEASESTVNSAASGCLVRKWGISKSTYIFRDRYVF